MLHTESTIQHHSISRPKTHSSLSSIRPLRHEPKLHDFLEINIFSYNNSSAKHPGQIGTDTNQPHNSHCRHCHHGNEIITPTRYRCQPSGTQNSSPIPRKQYVLKPTPITSFCKSAQLNAKLTHLQTPHNAAYLPARQNIIPIPPPSSSLHGKKKSTKQSQTKTKIKTKTKHTTHSQPRKCVLRSAT